MKIGLDIGPLRGARTGVGNYIYSLLKSMVAAGECSFTGFASGMQAVALEDIANQLRSVHIPVPTRILYKMWSLLNAPKIETFLGDVDLYHATNYFLAPTRKARRVVSIYDLSFLSVPELCSPKIARIFSQSVPKFAREADAVHVCSESTKREVVRLLNVPPEKVTVAHGAVDDDVQPVEKEDARRLVSQRFSIHGPYFLFVGTLEPRKNLPRLVEAFGRLAKDLPHHLVLAGVRGWNADAIFRTIERLGLNERVRITGFTSRHELLALYSAATAFVFPSLYEGFGLPVLEAMRCGCPVVASNNTSIPEVAGDAALLISAEDIAGIAAAMRRIFEDGALCAELVAKGKIQVARFSWETAARVTLDLYKRCLG